MTSSVSELTWSNVVVEAAMETVASVAQAPEQEEPPAQRNNHRRTCHCVKPWLPKDTKNKRIGERENKDMWFRIYWGEFGKKQGL